MKMVVIENGREIAKEHQSAVLLGVSERFRAGQLLRQSSSRQVDAPDRRSVAVAMLSVEIRMVKAFWTIARQPLGGTAPGDARRNGIGYLNDQADVHARYADAAGGKWEAIAPRPSLPSSKDIDSANAALDWLLLIDNETLRKLLVVGATSKRGDVGRRINWIRVRPSLPEFGETTVRTMQRRYQEALRIIVTELTIARLSSVSHIAA